MTIHSLCLSLIRSITLGSILFVGPSVTKSRPNSSGRMLPVGRERNSWLFDLLSFSLTLSFTFFYFGAFGTGTGTGRIYGFVVHGRQLDWFNRGGRRKNPSSSMIRQALDAIDSKDAEYRTVGVSFLTNPCIGCLFHRPCG